MKVYEWIINFSSTKFFRENFRWNFFSLPRKRVIPIEPAAEVCLTIVKFQIFSWGKLLAKESVDYPMENVNRNHLRASSSKRQPAFGPAFATPWLFVSGAKLNLQLSEQTTTFFGLIRFKRTFQRLFNPIAVWLRQHKLFKGEFNFD